VRLAVVVAAVLVLASCTKEGGEASEGVPGVRLGMAPRDVRDRFQPGGEGSWQTALGTGDDTILEWTSRDARSTMLSARFEFHLAMLVAIRARTRDAAVRDERVSVTPKTVTVRAPAQEGAGMSVTVLARDCPTHKDEAEALASHAR
jgi:hypothetical protein